ncbi:hypothetical protein [Arthrobacter sp. H14]|uniref:hypothetical protein n=1 Tax=Arthrobacter sp. H14 TaxID=1312959 RepID=UPI00047C107F|nr:hypothetical protein [Arthrobacter sp. H14]
MNATAMGLLAGLILGLVAVFGGFDAFLIVALLGAVGLVIGRVVDGKLDLRELFDRGRR